MDIEPRKLIREMGLKITNQRQAILEAFHAGPTHVTAQEVYERVNVNHPEIGFATVYRFLKKMVEQNIATEVRMGNLSARYELNVKNHHDHLTCTSCGKIVEFEDEKIEELQLSVAKKFRFQLTSHVLELYGLCDLCQLSTKA